MKFKFSFRRNKSQKDARVSLWKDGRVKDWLVARLVALTWCDGYFDGATVNHIDGNPMNNCASNLEWVSLKDNIHHGFETGLFPTQKPCALIDSNNVRYEFLSESQASRFLSRSNGYIQACLIHHREAKSVDGCVYRIELKEDHGERTPSRNPDTTVLL